MQRCIHAHLRSNAQPTLGLLHYSVLLGETLFGQNGAKTTDKTILANNPIVNAPMYAMRSVRKRQRTTLLFDDRLDPFMI
jgi:hypothetical protein